VRILVVNAGSSSLKLSVLGGDRLCRAQELPANGATVEPEDIARPCATQVQSTQSAIELSTVETVTSAR
jgi:hypothetical protein